MPIPPQWCDAEVQELGFVNPRNRVDDQLSVGFVPMPLMPIDFRTPLSFEERTWKDVKTGFTHIANGDVAVAKITPCFQNRKSTVVDHLPNGIGAGTTELLVLRPNLALVVPEYLLLFFKSRSFVDGGASKMTGTAGQQRLSTDFFATANVPLPSLDEQEKIVDRVTALTALCDQLEVKEKVARDLGSRLTKASLEALTTAETPEEFALAWKRVSDNFETIIDRSEKVEELRKAILGMALAGTFSRFGSDPVETWRRMNIDELSSFVSSGSRNWKDYASTSGAIFVRSQDIKGDFLDTRTPAFVAPPPQAEGTRTRVRENDILITITGANVGKCARVIACPDEAYVSQHVALVRPNDPAVAPWIHAWMTSEAQGRGALARFCYGDKPGLNLTQIKAVQLLVPPLKEQARLLALVDVLSRTSLALFNALFHGEAYAAKFAESVVRGVTA